MSELMNCSKDELLEIQMREFDDFLDGVWAIYIIPAGTMHDSGFEVMNFVAEFNDEDKEPIRCGAYCDDIELDGTEFRVDCTPEGIIRIHNRRLFSVSHDCSTITLTDGSGRFRRVL